MRNIKRTTSTIVIAAMLVSACGGGGATSAVTAPQPPTPQPVTAVFQTPQQENLTVADIQRIISQGVGEAQAQGQPSGFVVIDRVAGTASIEVGQRYLPSFDARIADLLENGITPRQPVSFPVAA